LTSTIAATVLAAGGGTRLAADGGGPKPLVELRGRPLVAYALAATAASGLSPRLLVVGHAGDDVAAVAHDDVEIVRNERWRDGISTSLHAALRRLDGRAVDGVVIGLADQPLVGAAAWQRLGAAGTDGAAIAVATYHGRRANPVFLARSVWPDALELRGDEGARQLFGHHPVVEVPCDGTGTPEDVDTLDDLDAIERTI
jgi:CTP:molybdopterin cytidylyltransferase MocA